jgi:hypothetical protein
MQSNLEGRKSKRKILETAPPKGINSPNDERRSLFPEPLLTRNAPRFEIKTSPNHSVAFRRIIRKNMPLTHCAFVCKVVVCNFSATRMNNGIIYAPLPWIRPQRASITNPFVKG